MLLRSRTPAHALRSVPDSRLPRPIVALLSGVLLVVIGLCAVAHGQLAGLDRPAPAVATASAWSAMANNVTPHGPHRHHGNEHCALDGAARTTAQAAQHPPADAGATVPVGVFGILVALSAHRRSPYRFRTRHTGRTALVRTSRWRI